MDRDTWERLRATLKARVGSDAYEAWFARLQFERCADGACELSVPTAFLKRWIAQHYGALLIELCKSIEPDLRIIIAVRGVGRPASIAAVLPAPPVEAAAPEFCFSSVVDSSKTLDTFCAANGNRLALAAAKTVRGPGGWFNPFYIHGPAGCGKSHLMQAIATAAGPGAVYMTAERFTHGIAYGVRREKMEEFRDHLAGAETLVLDDVQHLRGGKVQQEFRRALYGLLDGQRQIVLAADRPPSELDVSDERMRSRLCGGLVLEIAPLDEALRLDILTRRVEAMGKAHPGFTVPLDVLGFVAEHCCQNGRALDGALTRLFAQGQLTKSPITLQIAEDALRDMGSFAETRRMRIEDIITVVASHYKVSRADILSQRRTANVLKPRHMVAYLSRMLTLRSLPEIARRMGGRDHTTTLNSVRRIEEMMAKDPVLAADVRLLMNSLKGEVAA